MKFYLTQPRPALTMGDTGYHAEAKDWLEVSPKCAVVSLPNRVASPMGHKLIGQGPDLGGIRVSRDLRRLLKTDGRLKKNVRSNLLGPALFEAMTLGADITNDDAPNPIEPAKTGNSTLWFGGKELHQEKFDRTKENAIEVIARKRDGYATLRSYGPTAARKWLQTQVGKGLDYREVQGAHTGDGGPLKPSTVVSEVAASIPVHTWTGYNSTPDFTNSSISITEGAGHRAIHCESGVSDGDHTCTGTVTAGTTTSPLGPAVRMPAPLFLGTKWFYTIYWWSGNWYLRRHDLNNVGSFATLASGSRGGAGYLVEWITEASGSDISGSYDGNSEGPYTDTNGPDTQLYGGVYIYSSSAEMIPWELSDEAGGGGATFTTMMMSF